VLRGAASYRTTFSVVALAAVSLVASSCSSSPSHSGAPTASTQSTTSTTSGPAGSWSKAIAIAPGASLTTISCPSAGNCLVGDANGNTYRLQLYESKALGPALPSPSPQGTSYLSCATDSFCAAAPSENQVAMYNGTTWQPPTTVSGAAGFTAIDCTGPTFCVTIDGEGNSFAFDGAGWSGNLGAWGAANQIACVSRALCVAAEGGPTAFNGHSWTQPNDADAQGQRVAVSCASTPYCALVDSSGSVLTWNGLGFTTPTPIATEPPLSGTDASGLTGVSCPTATYCRAVDSIGRVFGWNGTSWSGGTLIDNGHALTAVSCPTTSYCVAVDRSGNAFFSG